MSKATDQLSPTDDELDALLRRTVRARPEPAMSSNLAARVIETARTHAPATPARPPARRGEWVAWVVAVAAMLAVLSLGYWRLAAVEAARAAYETTSSVTATATSASQIGSLLLVGLGALAASLVYLAVQDSLSRDDEPLRPGLI